MNIYIGCRTVKRSCFSKNGRPLWIKPWIGFPSLLPAWFGTILAGPIRPMDSPTLLERRASCSLNHFFIGTPAGVWPIYTQHPTTRPAYGVITGGPQLLNDIWQHFGTKDLAPLWRPPRIVARSI